MCTAECQTSVAMHLFRTVKAAINLKNKAQLLALLIIRIIIIPYKILYLCVTDVDPVVLQRFFLVDLLLCC